MRDDPKHVVERGYDAIANRFAAWQARISDETRLRYVADLLELLPNRRLAEEAGLEVVRDELERMVEPEGEVRWQWLLARPL